MKSRILSLIGLVAITIIWGSTFAIAKDLLNSVSPLQYLALRFSVVIIIILILSKGTLVGIEWKTLSKGVILGVLLSGGYIAQSVGLMNTTPSKSGFITGLYVPFVPIIGWCLRLTKLYIGNTIGIAIALVGFVLLCYPSGKVFHIGTGEIITFIGAAIFALHILSAEKFTTSSEAASLNMIQLIVCAVLLIVNWAGIIFIYKLKLGIFLPDALVQEIKFPLFTRRSILQLLYLALFATVWCHRVQMFAQQHLSATQTALILSLEPVFGAIIAYFFLQDALTGRGVFGAALILVGIILSEIIPKEKAPSGTVSLLGQTAQLRNTARLKL